MSAVPTPETNKRVVLVTNAPAPYRVPALALLARNHDISLNVIYCTRSHIDKTLDTNEHGFESYFLTKPYYAFERRFIHADIGIIKLLRELRPDVVITTGYIPTFLYAFLWAWWRGVPHIAMTDGTLKSERSYSWVRRLLRRIVLKRSASFIGACQGSLDLFKSYGVTEEKLFKAPLAINNQRFFNQNNTEEKVDFIFCGRLIKYKGPLFALEVVAEVSKRLGRIISIDFVGSGNQEDNLRQRAKELKDYVQVRFQGYATQEALPAYYKGAKIFLFPSEWDPWGVVGNEACAAGLPVIVSPYAGVAGELVLDGENGFIRELDLQQWATAAVDLLSNQALLEHMGDRAREIVQNFNFEAAANAMHAAIIKAVEKKQVKKIGIKQIVIVSLMRPSGTTGVQTHVNTFTAYLDSVSQPWQLVTPFSAPKLLLYPLLALRRLIEPIFPAAAVWLYRKGHAWLLGLVLQRVLKLSLNAAIYAQCPVSANVALDKRQSVSQQVTLVVHFNISQAEEWAGKGMITQHGPIYQWITDFEQRAIPQVDKLVFVSNYMQKQIQERIPAIAKINQQVIPNFVADPIPQNQTDIDADLIAIGTLEPRKNQTYLLDIIAAAKALGKWITLTLVGDGPDRALLENKAKYLGISEQVYFKGFVSNGSSLIARHQACIHVAKIENLPVTLIEALAYAKPIFACAVGGVPELFDEGVHGRTIPLYNANEAAKIIIATLENQTLVAQMGDAARHHFASNFEQKLLGKRLCEFVLSS